MQENKKHYDIKDEVNDLSGGPTKRDDEVEDLSLSARRRQEKENRLRGIKVVRQMVDREREERLRNVSEERKQRIRKRTSEFGLRNFELDSITKEEVKKH